MTDRIKENYTESIQTKIAAAEALPDAIHTAAQMITICLLNGHKVLACGNGPSAALAQLFISELVNCYETQRPSLPGMALTPDMATISAIATDHGFEEVYAKQIRALGQPRRHSGGHHHLRPQPQPDQGCRGRPLPRHDHSGAERGTVAKWQVCLARTM